MQTITQQLQQLATEQAARRYAAATEKYLYCCDLLEAANITATEPRVSYLEDCLEEVAFEKWGNILCI